MTEIDAIARRSYGKLVAFLAARTRDVAEAEDALSEAFAKALEVWPRDGVPRNPEAWLLTVARRRVIDMQRRQRRAESLEWLESVADDHDIPDQRLALMFTCAHPAIEAPIRAPLMLQVVLGLDATMIASAFLMAPATMGQRLVRAKTKIRQAGIPFRIPDREELPDRLDTVLDAIYAAFGESWTDGGRRDLSEEAVFLGRLVVELLPDQPEALGLLALMLHVDARRAARRSSTGEYVPLAEQDVTLWNAREIDEAEALLERASTLGAIGRYQLEGAVQSAHVHRCRTNEDNWADVVELYDALYAMSESPVVAINRALAIAAQRGAPSGLDILRALAGDRRLAEYQPYWAALAELLAQTGVHHEARRAYDIAIGLERDPAVRDFLRQRQERMAR
ncbi:MAG TPA: DUF6596 domain-containing protein [Gemmatimonadaceae bacterium]|nr:DUF6596 domain-containing protein [Gemmatimonadaceae bacterium]